MEKYASGCKYMREAAGLAAAIRVLANNPERLDNLTNYLSQHFDVWMKKWASTPEEIVTEFQAFAEMGEIRLERNN